MSMSLIQQKQVTDDGVVISGKSVSI